jgi:glycogen debranching enzyme
VAVDGTDGPLELPPSIDAEVLARARGAMFIITDRHGDVVPAGARELGLFHRDTRYLSHWHLRVGRGEVVHLSADSSGDVLNQIDLMVSDVDEAEFLDDPKNFLHIRRRQLLDDGLLEEITLTNFLTHPVSISLDLAFAVDFADIFEVRGARRPRRGTYAPPEVAGRSATVFSYRGLCGNVYRTTIGFRVPPTTLSAERATFSLDFAANEVKTIVVEVGCASGAGKARPAPRTLVADRVARIGKEAAERRAECTSFACDDPLLASVLERSASDVHALVVGVEGQRILGAGIPWFCAPFGRDSLLSAYALLAYSPMFAVDTLRMLAAHQGKRFVDETEEEPGKIFHELRFGEMTRVRETPHAPYYGSIDATPLFVVLAGAVHQILADVDVLRSLRPALIAALRWIDARSADGKELVTYERKTPRGIENQCWKDSRAGVSAPEGWHAVPPVAVCEVQGYCIDAYRTGARLLAALGEHALAKTYAQRAARLGETFEELFWLPAKRRYAYAIDGKGRVLDTIVSNLGHLLWSRAVPDKRAPALAKLLLSPESFSGFGIRTLAERQPVYNPLSYHNGTVWPHDNAIIARGLGQYDLKNEALRVFEGLHAAMAFFRDHRLPELFCGIPRTDGPLVRYPVACSPQAWAAAAPFLLLQTILGIEPDGPGGKLLVRNPQLPPFLRRVEIKRMRVGRSHVSMRFRRVAERCHIEALEIDGPPIRTLIEID